MHLENLTDEVHDELCKSHRNLTRAALVDVFGKTEDEARRIVENHWRRYKNVARSERNLLLHNHPINLAADIIGANSEDLSSGSATKYLRRYEADLHALENRMGVQP